MQKHPFNDVNRKLALVFKRIEKLDNEITEFVKICQYAAVIETDSTTGDKWFKVKIASNIPEEIFEDVAIAIYLLRSLLDQMTVSLGIICGLAETKHLYFPFERTKSNYFKTNGGRKKVKGLKPDLIAIFDSFMPYKDEGDANFYSLADLANVDKHNMILPLGSFGNTNFINGLAIKKAKQPLILNAGPWRLDEGIPISNLGKEGTVEVITKNSEIVVITTICFGNIEIAQGESVIPKLKQFAVKVEEIVQTFKSHCESNSYY